MDVGPGAGRQKWPFAGRQGDLAFAHRLLVGPPGRGLVLAGTQGIGKTRLAAEVRREVEQAGLAVFHAAASPAISTLPLGALLPLVEMPENRDDPMRASLALASRQLAGLAGGEPFVLSVDDGHLLDDSSATVIHQLAATHGIAVLLTVSVEQPSPPDVRALWKDGLAERIELEPLGPAAVDQVLDEALDRPVDVGTRHVLAGVSGGNPLFLRELVLGSIQSGTLREIGGQWRLSDGRLNATGLLIELVEDRLEGVEPEARSILDALALGGGAATPLITDDLDPDGRMVENLEEQGVVSVGRSRRRRTLELVHPVHAEVLRRGVTSRRASELLRRIGDSLQASGARRREDVLRLASIRVDSGGEVDPELMCRAASQASIRHDDVLAERLARAAHDAGGGPEAALLLGRCLQRTGQVDAADEIFSSVDLDDTTERLQALLAIEHAETLFYGLGRLGDATRRIDGTHSRLADPTWKDQLVATGSAYKLMGGDPLGALADADRVIADGRPRAVVSAALIAAPALVLLGRCVDAVDATTQGLDTRAGLDDHQGTTYEGMLLMARSFAMSEAGHLGEAIETAALGFDVSVADGVVLGQSWFAMMRGRALLVAGDLADAERWFREGLSGFEELAQSGLDRWCQAGIMWAAAMAGDGERAGAEHAVYTAMARNNILMLEPEMLRAEAWVSIVDGRFDDAASQLLAAAEMAADSSRVALEMGALHDLVRIGRGDVACNRLIELGGQVQGELAAARGTHARCLWDGDAEGLVAVGQAFDGLGTPLLAAEATAQAVPLLIRSGERRAAARVSARAQQLAASGGGATPALALAGPGAELTDREREIAALAASGMASKAIAEELFVSRRTVDNHLHRVYEKLGVSGRDELATAMGAPG